MNHTNGDCGCTIREMAGELGKLQTAGGTSCCNRQSDWCHFRQIAGGTAMVLMARVSASKQHDMRKVAHLRGKNKEKDKAGFQ